MDIVDNREIYVYNYSQDGDVVDISTTTDELNATSSDDEQL
jgi:hypothetical protein